MVDMQRLRVVWSGWGGANGISTFYFRDATNVAASVKALWTYLNVDLPSATAVTVDNGGDVIRDTDGELVGGWAGQTITPQGGADAGGFSSATGFQIKWLTDAYADGSRIVGRTYFVPASRTAFDSAGNVLAATRTRATVGGNTLAAAVLDNMLVWRRPRKAVPAWTGPDGRSHPAIPFRPGAAYPIKTATCPTKAVVLRSRRD